MSYYKFYDESPNHLVCAHVKEALNVIKWDGDYFSAGISIWIAKELTKKVPIMKLLFAEKMPENFVPDIELREMGYAYYGEGYAIIKFEEED
jgi:hypothetical protein